MSIQTSKHEYDYLYNICTSAKQTDMKYIASTPNTTQHASIAHIVTSITYNTANQSINQSITQSADRQHVTPTHTQQTVT